MQLVMMLVLQVMKLVKSAALQLDVCSSGLVSVVYLWFKICWFEGSSNINSGIGLGMAVNIAILAMGWPYAFGEFQAYPNIGVKYELAAGYNSYYVPPPPSR